VTAPLFTPAAERDLQAAARWIAEDNPAAAETLMHAALTAAKRLRARPAIGRVREDLAPARYRFWSLRGFPYLLVYDSVANPPHVVRIVHTSRDLPRALLDIGLDDL
jgi:toxin ParE1/3/4